MVRDARASRADHFADEIKEISDDTGRDMVEIETKGGAVRVVPNPAAATRDRLQCDTRKWLMERWNPAKYGRQERLELTGAGGGPILLEQITLVAMQRIEAERSAMAKMDIEGSVAEVSPPYNSPRMAETFSITSLTLILPIRLPTFRSRKACFPLAP